jgi:beta-glucosidase
MNPTPSRETMRRAAPDRNVTRTPLFLFATGIENSNPTIENGRVRRDQMEECGHYRLWERDFDLVEELGIRFLRYGPPLHKTFLGQGRYDWDFADLTFAQLKAREIVPIVDLCHFGVPDWIGDFQNPDFPVRPDGAYHQWRKVPSRELSIDLVADERPGRATGLVEAS